MNIDAHQHFWQYDPARHGWINDKMAVLKRDFLPADLEKVYAANGIDGCVAVQADQSEEETTFLLDLAAEYAFVKGVVGWVDLRAENLAERLAHFSQFSRLCGFRHVVQSEPDPDFMLREDFRRGLARLHDYDFTYDILIYPTQLEAALQTVRDFPLQKFVIDHIAKPHIKSGEIDAWARVMREIARSENVWCKVSGMVTEADWDNWKYDDFVPYLDGVFEAFGEQRLMFGSDWPVCLLAGNYERVKGLLARYLGEASAQSPVWGANAIAFYGLGE